MIPAEEVSAVGLYLDLERALKAVAHRLEPQEQWLISGKLFPLRRALGLGGPRYRLAGGPMLVGAPVPPPDPEDTLS